MATNLKSLDGYTIGLLLLVELRSMPSALECYRQGVLYNLLSKGQNVNGPC